MELLRRGPSFCCLVPWLRPGVIQLSPLTVDPRVCTPFWWRKKNTSLRLAPLCVPGIRQGCRCGRRRSVRTDGFLVWDLMHLNTDGFTVEPNGGSINGCVDADSFYNPMWAMQAIDADMDLEQALERTVATQYLEVCGARA